MRQPEEKLEQLETTWTTESDLITGVNALRFARERLQFDPDDIQAEIMTGNIHRGLLNCSRQWGKSTVTAAMALHRAWTIAATTIVVVSPSARQSGEFLRKVNTFAQNLNVRIRGDGHNEMSLLLPNGSRIIGLPGTEGTIRGFSAISLVLIDEAGRVTDDLYKSVRPFLAVTNGDLFLMSTPNGQSGFFYEEWTNGGPLWTRFTVPATACPRIAPDFLAGERRTMGEEWFDQEYMCRFTSSNTSLFSRDTIERAFSDDVKPLFRR